VGGEPAVIILALRTDKPEAELYLYNDTEKLAELKWPAHLKLAETLHTKIKEILNKSSISDNGLGGVAVYKGPGSFTGLRIGLSVGNALAYARNIPIVGTSGDQWLAAALKALLAGQNDKIVVPEYGAPVRVTKPRK
jgi:tRNA threonylcarbamoyladenosine biosynthesis protein TsaB